MADLIKIKGSDTTATPPSLSARELAYSEASGNLFIGRISDGTPVVIGGKTAIDKLATIESGAQVNTVDSVAGQTGAVTLDSGDITDFATAVDGVIATASIDDLSDVSTPTPSNDQVLTYVTANNRWEAKAVPSGVTSFIALNDTPANFTSAGGYIVKVNAGATALEFVDGIDGGTF